MSELLERILSRDNMNTAYKRVCANKGAGGVDDVTVEQLGDYIKEISAPYGFHASKNTWKLNVDGTYINPIKVLALMSVAPNLCCDETKNRGTYTHVTSMVP